MQPIAFQQNCCTAGTPFSRTPTPTSNSECNTNSNSALLEKNQRGCTVQPRQSVATCMRNVPSNLTNRDFDRYLSAKSPDVTHIPSTRSCHPPHPPNNVTMFQHATSIPTLVICLNRPQQGDNPSDRLGGGALRRRIVQNVQLIPERRSTLGSGMIM